MSHFNYSSLARVNQTAAQCSAIIRRQQDHFCVDEILPFEPEGEGDHVWLYIEKRGVNTSWVVEQLARFAQVNPVAIGYAGLKDRHAVTKQWFSVNLQGKQQPNWQSFQHEQIIIIEQTYHPRKLKRGVLSGNQFRIRLTDIAGDKLLWQQHLNAIEKQGVPNYFGEQRFGNDMNNLNRVNTWFNGGDKPKKRQHRSLYLSAARSWLFNLVLSQRVAEHNWNQAITGDVMLLSGTKASCFSIDISDAEIKERVETFDIHPTGPLWGQGELASDNQCLLIEQQVLSEWQSWQNALAKQGLKQQRRALRLIPEQWQWQFVSDTELALSFYLPAGSYATAVMRELANYASFQHKN